MKRNDVLKIIAMVTMLIDHIGYMFYPELKYLRIIGRIAYPIFAYMIAMGWTHTSSKKDYFIRLSIFGLISQIPYSYFNPELKAEFLHFNVIILFTFSLGALWLVDQFKKNKNYFYLLLIIPYVFIPTGYELYFQNAAFSYSTYGVLMVLLFYVFKNPLLVMGSYLLLTLYYNYVSVPLAYVDYFSLDYVRENYEKIVAYVFKNSSQQYSVISAAIIVLLSRFEFKISLNKYVGYLFYPVHMAVIILIVKYTR